MIVLGQANVKLQFTYINDDIDGDINDITKDITGHLYTIKGTTETVIQFDMTFVEPSVRIQIDAIERKLLQTFNNTFKLFDLRFIKISSKENNFLILGSIVRYNDPDDETNIGYYPFIGRYLKALPEEVNFENAPEW